MISASRHEPFVERCGCCAGEEYPDQSMRCGASNRDLPEADASYHDRRKSARYIGPSEMSCHAFTTVMFLNERAVKRIGIFDIRSTLPRIDDLRPANVRIDCRRGPRSHYCRAKRIQLRSLVGRYHYLGFETRC